MSVRFEVCKLDAVLRRHEAVDLLDSAPPAEALTEVVAMLEVKQAWIVKLPPAGEMPPWLAG